ncbi:MAG: efflux RND transporter periplasmic adaptor subunit [Deltaproteobacteria bacterium]|nr:efflux RND transporter periplasmic adaptor subunit [Deltaproteobacteria bacterium]
MKKWILIAAVAAALVVAGFYLMPRSKTAKSPEPDPTATAQRGPLVDSVASDGKVVSDLDVEIKCKASGEIVKLPFDVSQAVKKGQLLVELDPVDEERSVRQAQAALASSQAKLVSARENLALEVANLVTDRKRSDSALASAQAQAQDARAKANRVKELLARKLASQEEYETAETSAVQAAAALDAAKIKPEELRARERALELNRQQIRVAEAQVENDRIALEVARQRLSDTRVMAPMDGVVTARDVQVGQIISSPISNVGGGTTVLTLSDLRRMYVLASVDEADIGKVRVDQPVKVTVDAYPGKRFAGTVVRISPRGVNVSNVVTFEVKIEVTSPDKDLLRPEMTANVEIVAARKDDALLIPADAVVRKGGKPRVTVVKADGTREERPVEVGIGDGQKLEITAGLSAGETIVVRKGEAGSKWSGNRGPGNPLMMGGRPH